MSGFRLLVCVDRSRAALEAARLAIRLVADHGGQVLVVSVLDEREATSPLGAVGGATASVDERLAANVRSVVDRITTMADAAGVLLATELLEGEPLRVILRRARQWSPDMVLIGRTGRAGPGSPMVGSLAMHVVEFAEWPVVLVPVPG